jgi:hypothetical protein
VILNDEPLKIKWKLIENMVHNCSCFISYEIITNLALQITTFEAWVFSFVGFYLTKTIIIWETCAMNTTRAAGQSVCSVRGERSMNTMRAAGQSVGSIRGERSMNGDRSGCIPHRSVSWTLSSFEHYFANLPRSSPRGFAALMYCSYLFTKMLLLLIF